MDEEESRLNWLSNEVPKVEKKLSDTSKELLTKSLLVDMVKKAEDLGLRPSQLGTFVEAARKLGARHSLGLKESIDRLEVDLRENWEPKLGFENDKTKLTAELNQLQERVELAEERESVTLEKIRAHEGSLRDFEQLRKHVSSSELIEFKRVIVDSGQDVPSFRGEVERLGSVTAAVDAVKLRKEAEVAKLEARVTFLGAQVEQLSSTKTELEAKISTLNSKAVESVINASNKIAAGILNVFLNRRRKLCELLRGKIPGLRSSSR